MNPDNIISKTDIPLTPDRSYIESQLQQQGSALDLDLSGLNMAQINLSGIDLSGANLKNTNLKGANLTEAKLKNVNFSHAQLNGARLSYAHLEGANLRRADLLEAKLNGAYLRGTVMTKANLSGADLSNAVAIQVNLQSADLSDTEVTEALLLQADLRDADLRRANFQEADLRQADLQGANLGGIKFNGAILTQANLTGVKLIITNLHGCNLREAIMHDIDLSWSDLSEADLVATDLSGANLSWSNLSNADLRDADLTGANLSGANLAGAKLSGAKLQQADLSGAELRGAFISQDQRQQLAQFTGLLDLDETRDAAELPPPMPILPPALLLYSDNANGTVEPEPEMADGALTGPEQAPGNSPAPDQPATAGSLVPEGQADSTKVEEPAQLEALPEIPSSLDNTINEEDYNSFAPATGQNSFLINLLYFQKHMPVFELGRLLNVLARLYAKFQLIAAGRYAEALEIIQNSTNPTSNTNHLILQRITFTGHPHISLYMSKIKPDAAEILLLLLNRLYNSNTYKNQTSSSTVREESRTALKTLLLEILNSLNINNSHATKMLAVQLLLPDIIELITIRGFQLTEAPALAQRQDSEFAEFPENSVREYGNTELPEWLNNDPAPAEAGTSQKVAATTRPSGKLAGVPEWLAQEPETQAELMPVPLPPLPPLPGSPGPEEAISPAGSAGKPDNSGNVPGPPSLSKPGEIDDDAGQNLPLWMRKS